MGSPRASLVEVMPMLGLEGESWAPWRVVAKVLDAEPLRADEQAFFEVCTGRTRPPKEPPAECFVIKGRRCGGSRFGGAFSTRAAGFTRYDGLAPGERAVVALASSDREQARVLLGYASAPFEADDGLRSLVRPRSTWQALRDLVTRQTRWGFDLKTGATVEVRTADYGSIRGRTFAAVVADEVAFWQRDDGSSPASEVLTAIRPGLVTLNGQLLVLSTPFAKHGPLWEAFDRYWGKDDDRVLVWRAPSRLMNPLIPESVVQDALERDEASARAEWLAEFRSDVESYISREVIARVVVPGRTELPPRLDDEGDYLAFVDPSGGAGQDSMTLAIVHLEVEHDEDGRAGRSIVVVDLVREVRPPFNPAPTVRDFAATLHAYGCTVIHGDRFGGQWVSEAFATAGVAYWPCSRSRSELYAEFLPLLTTASVELPDSPRLIAQLHALERRPGGGGRESIDHARTGHDDVVNAVAGACVLAHGQARGSSGRMLVSLGA